jgi:ABC-2 type transport system ATP-binding protein
MTTPYLDEAERCGRVCMLNNGQSMITDNPDNIKKLMKGTVIEIVCDKIRDSYHLLKNTGFINEVQIFGDKINVVLQDKNRQFPEIQNLMMANNINITQWRVIPPSLENVFISLLKS